MTSEMYLPLLLAFIASAISLLAALIIAASPLVRRKLGSVLSSFAAGVLLSTAVLHLLPEAINGGKDVSSVSWAMMAAIASFFVLERLTVWFHHHHEVGKNLSPGVVRVLLGDGLHNMIDGFAIATTSMADWRLGVLTAVAIGAHEIPQEMADFTVLLKSGMSPTKALFWNAFSAVTAFIGVFLGLFLQHSVDHIVPYGLAASAGMFLYIALSDLIPSLHEHEVKKSKSSSVLQLLLFFSGILMLQVVERLISTWMPNVH